MNKLTISLLIIFSLLSICCNDAPTAVGTGFLQDTMAVEIIAGIDDVIIPNTYSYVVSHSAERNTGSMLVGEADNLKSGALLRFNIPTNRGALTAEQIISSKYYLGLQRYGVGDTASSNQLNFVIREVTSSWSQTETSFADVFEADKLFVNSREIGRWSGQVERKDTMEVLEFDFPKDICLEWFQKIGGGINIVDTIWGIALMPDVGCTIINAFQSLSNISATSGSYIRILYYTDTTKSTIDSFDISTAEGFTFAGTTEVIADGKLTIQGGIRTHSRIDFDISELSSLDCINYSELTLYVDETLSYLGNVAVINQVALRYFADTTAGEKILSSELSVVGEYDSLNKCFTFKDYLQYPLNKFIREKGGKGTLVLTFTP